jgi:hypothetical protein
MKGTIILALGCFFMIFPGKTGAAEPGRYAGSPWFDGTRRFGIFIGSNNGGRDRIMLRYAVSDARAVSKVFTDMGGIYDGDNLLLVEPSVGDINRRIQAIRNQVIAARQSNKRTELVFYYSGHSDEDGLLLNRERYAYKDLREQINQIPSDMRIVILDSCSSGAFTRAKGGVKTQPFLIDSSVSAEGYAFLTSSSATEASQESDSIASSYFTHSLVAGLRGAADTIGDGRVTLNEVYRFAYAETLAKTETSVYGAQHPSYDMQISGTGDVVLTDIKETSASLVIDPDITGRLSIRDAADYLVAEITKAGNRPMELGLEPGLYRITLQQGDRFYRTELILDQDGQTSLAMGDFTPIAPLPAQARGEGEAAGDAETGELGDQTEMAPAEGTGGERTEIAGDEAVPREPVNIQVVPGVGIFGIGTRKAENSFLLGIIGAAGYNLNGAGLAFIGISNTGTVRGLQAAGIYTMAGKDFRGLQAAGIFNTLGADLRGAQAAGIYNIAGGNIEGLQAAGIFNIAEGNIRGLQAAGIFNIARGDFHGAQLAGIFNSTEDNGMGLRAAGIFNYTGGDFAGLQAAGLVNIAKGNTRGLQAGLVNIGGKGGNVQIGLVNVSQNELIVPIGLVNIVKGGIMHPAVYYDDTQFINLSFRSGSHYIYSLASVGTQRIHIGGDASSWTIGEKGGDSLLVYRLGMGAEFPFGKRAFLNLDFTTGNILDLDTLDGNGESMEDHYNSSASGIHQARLTAGFKAFEHLGVFVGVSYDYIHRYTGTSPNPTALDGLVFGWSNDRNIHKLGIFGGIQF